MNLVLLLTIGGFAWRGTQVKQVLTRSNATGSAAAGNSGEPLDQISSADIAVNAAKMVGLAETVAISNQADSVAASLAVSPADSTVIAKPQTVATAFFSRKDIKNYVVAGGDTVSSIAAKFNITSDSIIWSNNLSGNSVNAGTKLVVPPANGIVYTVKAGDTIDSLASKYLANKDQLVAVNDIELTGLKVGDQILIPNGQQPAAVARASASFAWGGSAVYGSNGYDYGFCTWYVANRRAELGNPVPSNLGNAYSWYSIASRAGLSTGTTPRLGAVLVNQPGDHVAVVEQMNDDGSFWISEMNSRGQVGINDSRSTGGWGVRDYKLIPASAASHYGYIY
ncbi:MAG TPA: LysM peptidoglycan-binding domain-containing protein [Patescibacteria group bacterium]|nr:LysM peptidoglycan-binding domain-containing protein [Patescibacteria group bacterium]